MKLINFDLSKNFNDLRDLMMAPYIEWGEINWSGLDTDHILAELEGAKGIEVESLPDYVQKDGTFEFQGIKVLAYIRDQYGYYQNPKEDLGYKFHIANCSTIRSAYRNNRMSRYVLSRRTDGVFIVKVIDKTFNKVTEEFETRLSVCKNCLQHLNYDGYDHTDYSKIGSNYNIFGSFDMDEFFKKYKGSMIVNKPKYSEFTAPLNVYPENFDKIAKRVKQINKWNCEGCGLNLEENGKYLHVHHKDADKSNNSLENLESLCIKCHSEKPGHSYLKKNPDYKEFLSLGLAR